MSSALAAAVFLSLHLIEWQLVTLPLVGRRLAIDPVRVLLGLTAFGWSGAVARLPPALVLLSGTTIIAARAAEGNAVATALSHQRSVTDGQRQANGRNNHRHARVAAMEQLSKGAATIVAKMTEPRKDRGNSLPALGNRREREVLLAVNYISIVLRY
jgi:hypothetical protein